MAFVAGATRVGAEGGGEKSQNRKNVYLSPYVEEPLNSKVIKIFVPELRSRKCFSCFEIPMFYVYIYMNIITVLRTGMNMSISHIHVWLCYIRYADDLLLLTNTIDKINTIQETFQNNSVLNFTLEININNKILFLGVLIDARNINRFTTSTYKKKLLTLIPAQ